MPFAICAESMSQVDRNNLSLLDSFKLLLYDSISFKRFFLGITNLNVYSHSNTKGDFLEKLMGEKYIILKLFKEKEIICMKNCFISKIQKILWYFSKPRIKWNSWVVRGLQMFSKNRLTVRYLGKKRKKVYEDLESTNVNVSEMKKHFQNFRFSLQNFFLA